MHSGRSQKPSNEKVARAGASEPETLPFPVVGVGASAGGLEAFIELLLNLPSDTGMAFVLLQHLDPSHESRLPELLSMKTDMPVIEAINDLAIAPNSVYVMPSEHDMTIEGGALRLRSRSGSGYHLPIDSFLKSLAADLKTAAVAVILSGSGSDGAKGLQAVKGNGGTTLAQEPSSAKYPSMPQAAVATGAVDFVLPTARIAQQLATMAARPLSSAVAVAPESRPPKGEDPLLADLLAIVRSATKADFTNYKQGTVLRRIERRMMLRHVDDLEKYVQLLRSDSAEVDALYQDLLIRVTSFFRQPSVFETLKASIFPQIAGAKAGEQVRFWVPGCSTGEEAYSLAMAWVEFSGAHHVDKASFQLFATDINQEAIDQARGGVFPATISSQVSPDRLAQFFVPVEDGYRISESLRAMCVFARHDLTRDPPFSRLDLISLRNVLIYLGPLLQRRVLPALHFALRPGGFLLLGESESVGGFTNLFSVTDRKSKVFGRREGLATIPPSPGPLTRAAEGVPAPATSSKEFSPTQEADRLILEKYAPAGVLVDADLRVQQFRGRTSPYLELVPGRASLNLTRLVRDGLAAELRSAVREAQKEGSPVYRRGIRILREGEVATVGLDVIPLKSPSGEAAYLVLFQDMSPASTVPLGRNVSPASGSDDTSDHVAELERELGEMREYARAVLEDKESANEELRSANEELQSTNEELQSVNEELETSSEEIQSTNEELRTVNDEMHSLNQRLSSLNQALEAKNADLHELNAALDAQRTEATATRDYAQAIIDTLREPLVVLDRDFRVVSVSPPFHHMFGGTRGEITGRSFFQLEGGEWDTTELRAALAQTVAEGRHFQDLLVEKDFSRLGQRSMLLSGGVIQAAGEIGRRVLVAIEDVTDRMRMEAERELHVADLEVTAKDLASRQEQMRARSRRLSLAHRETSRLLNQESSLLRRLQEVFTDVPQELPGVRFGHLYRSATEEARIGGDFYDVFGAKQGRIGLLIGDVSGHGIEAARTASLIKDTVHAFAHQFRHPRLVLRETNRLLAEKNLPGFTTVFLSFLDPESGTLVYSSAGHPPPLLAADGQVSLLEQAAAPLGAFLDSHFRDKETHIGEQAVLLLYTDGVTEARDLNGVQFGERGLSECLRCLAAEPVETLPGLVMDELLRFSAGRLHDDAAMLAIRYVGNDRATNGQ